MTVITIQLHSPDVAAAIAALAASGWSCNLVQRVELVEAIAATVYAGETYCPLFPKGPQKISK